MPLQRSREHRIIAGVCGGIAEWLGWPPWNVRIAYVILSALTAFAGIPVYVLLWLIVPEEPRFRPFEGEWRQEGAGSTENRPIS